MKKSFQVRREKRKNVKGSNDYRLEKHNKKEVEKKKTQKRERGREGESQIE